jgi:hypothetical protein
LALDHLFELVHDFLDPFPDRAFHHRGDEFPCYPPKDDFTIHDPPGFAFIEPDKLVADFVGGLRARTYTGKLNRFISPRDGLDHYQPAPLLLVGKFSHGSNPSLLTLLLLKHPQIRLPFLHVFRLIKNLPNVFPADIDDDLVSDFHRVLSGGDFADPLSSLTIYEETTGSIVLKSGAV